MMYLTKTGFISNSAIVVYWSHKGLNTWRKYRILIMEMAHQSAFKNICLSRCLARTTENTLRQLRHWHAKRTKVCFYGSLTSNGKSLWMKWPLIFMSALEERAIKSISSPFLIFLFTACGLSQPSKGNVIDPWQISYLWINDAKVRTSRSEVLPQPWHFNLKFLCFE